MALEKHREGELRLFLKHNESGFQNLVVYLFWIIVSEWFNEQESQQFPDHFVGMLRESLCEQYRLIYFKYLIRLRNSVRENIIDILPFFLSEMIRILLVLKLSDIDVPMQRNRTFLIII